MRTSGLVAGCVGLLLGIGMTLPSHADVTNFAANVFGTSMGPQNCAAPPASCEFLLSQADGAPQNYAGFTIAGIDANHPAKIVAVEGVADQLFIQDAVIKATAAAQTPCTYTSSGIENCPTIYFSALFAAPPSTAGQNVDFVRSISGTLMRGSPQVPATGSAVKVRGIVVTSFVGSDGYKRITCGGVGCGDLFSPAPPTQIYDTSQRWYQNGNPALPDPREISGQMWVYPRYANDVLTVNNLAVKNPPGSRVERPQCFANKKPGQAGRPCKQE